MQYSTGSQQFVSDFWFLGLSVDDHIVSLGKLARVVLAKLPRYTATDDS